MANNVQSPQTQESSFSIELSFSSINPIKETLHSAATQGNVTKLKDLLPTNKDEALQKLSEVDGERYGQTVLHKVALRLHADCLAKFNGQETHYGECLRLILDRATTFGMAKDLIHQKDEYGNTAVHYAAQSGNDEAVLLLLEKQPNLLLKNERNQTALDMILPSTLDTFMDRCISVPKDRGESWKDFYVMFDYNFLSPSSENKDENSVQIKHSECEVLMNIIRSSKNQHLIRHPLVTSFLLLKWHTLRWFFYLNLLTYVIYVLICTIYFLLIYSNDNQVGTKATDASDHQHLWYLLVVFLGSLWLRECLQIIVIPKQYFTNFENYLELPLLICNSIVLACWKDPASMKHLSALVLLLAWITLWLLIGRIPLVSVYISMFITVARSFLRLLAISLPLLVGFVLSFFLVFNPTEGETSQLFPNVTDTMIKLSAMTTGEFDVSNLPFYIHPVMSRLVFFAFLLLTNMVFLNLLTGWAVSDIQAIKDKAITIAYLNRLETISYMESAFLGSPFIPDWVRQLAPRLRIVHFHNLCLLNRTFMVDLHSRINSRNAADYDLNICCCHQRFVLDDRILRSALQIALERRQTS